MADEPDVTSEITPEDFDGEQPDKAESSPAKEAKDSKETPKAEKTEAKDTKEKGDAVVPPDVPTKEADKEDVPEKDKGEVDKPADEDKPKDETPNPKSENRFQTLANENRELRRQNEQLIAQTYQPATEAELTSEINPETGENYNRLEAKFEAYRQQQELEKYGSQVSEAQSILGNEAYSVMSEFPAFNPENEQFDEELATEASQLLEANLIRDPNVAEVDDKGQPTGKGIIIGSNVSPYQLYKTLARASGISGTKGQLKGQQDTEKMLANADTAGSSAPPKKAEDPLMKLFLED